MNSFKLFLVALVFGALAPVAPVVAQEGFTFKRVKPPQAGAARRITIQVAPAAVPQRLLDHVPDLPDLPDETVASLAPAVPRSDHWFWAQVSPSIADAGVGRLAAATLVLANAPAEAALLRPGAARLRAIVSTYGAEILRATAGTRVSPALVVAVISTESAGRPQAKSHAGAQGLMQLMPATAARFGVTAITDPAQNIAGGVKYLDFLLAEFGGDAILALAGYNAGEGAVRKSNGVPDYRETRGYVPKVVAAWDQARMLCITPPQTATDGCLFNGLRIAAN